jgi:hypothetical protein
LSEVVLVGNNLAVLVAAVELAEAGREVVLLTDGRGPGGHFRGLRLSDGGTEIGMDIGMVLVESVRAPVESRELADYQPRRRYDWTRYGSLVDEWLQARVRLVRTPTPEVLVDGRRWPDHLLANRLDVLAHTDLPAPAALPRDDPRHAAHKTTSPVYDTLTYAEAAELNHGREIQRRLIEPFATKLFGPAYDSLLARYHRVGWLPLYWPETLTAAQAGQPTGLAEYPFWTTSSGFVGDLVRSLEDSLGALGGVTVHDEAIDSLSPVGSLWEVRTRDGSRWSTSRPVLGLTHERLQPLLGLPARERATRVSVVAMCCLVRSSAIGAPVGSLSVLDPDFTAYRVTDQDALAGRDPEWHRVVVEAGPSAADLVQSGADVTAALVGELGRLLELRREPSDGVRVLRTLTAAGAITVPTPAFLSADAAAHDALAEACPGTLLTGALLDAGVTSMNDQIVQGLAVARELS